MSVGAQQLSWTIEPDRPRISGSQALSWRIGVSADTLLLQLENAPSGMVGVLTVEILTGDASVTVYPPSTQGLVEAPAGSGRYTATIPLPDPGRYLVVWSDGSVIVTQTLLVIDDEALIPPFFATTAGEFELRVGSTAPALVATLRNFDRSPIDLSVAESVIVRVRQPGRSLLLEREASILDDGTAGVVVLEWQDGETTVAGDYAAEWDVAMLGVGTLTVPSVGAFRFTISANLDD